jgi:hypothetical protein
MLTKTLAATAALSMLIGGGAALAQSKPSVTAGPKQPIPYSQLNAYTKASPKARATKDWWTGSPTAQTGMSTDTSATAPGMNSGAMSGSSTDSSSMGTMGSSSSPMGGSVNPPMSGSSMPSTPPIDGGTQPNGSTPPNPATPTDPMSSSTPSPIEPK